MIGVVDTFLPVCHEFLGKVFVKIPWQLLVRPDDENMVKVISSLLHIATKLSSEPQVRQVGFSFLIKKPSFLNCGHTINWYQT